MNDTDFSPGSSELAELLAVRGRNNSGPAAFILKLEMTYASGRKETIVSDTSWFSSTSSLSSVRRSVSSTDVSSRFCSRLMLQDVA